MKQADAAGGAEQDSHRPAAPATPAHFLYECAVLHRRLLPRRHEFLYNIFLFYLDLDRLGELDRLFPLVGIERPALYSFRRSDHLGGASQAPLRETLSAWLAERGLEQPARVHFLTSLRFLGYVFNPIAIFFCTRADGSPLAAVAQVGNTFGEQKLYLVPPSGPPDYFHARRPKNYYVSPFSDLDLDFDFRIFLPTRNLRIHVDDYRGKEKILVSTLTGRQSALNASNLLRLTAKFPFITLKVIFLIHWQALRLWLRKFPHHRKEDNPGLQTDVLHSK